MCYILLDAMKNRRRKTSLTKYLPLTLLQEFKRGYSRFVCERVLEIEQKLQYFYPHSYGRHVVSFLFSRAAQREVQRATLLGDGFLYCILSASSLDPKLHRGSRGPPRSGVAFPTTSRLSPTATLLQLPASVLTELYNSSSRTRSLEWHV